jgi:2'-5' RNA ligase
MLVSLAEALETTARELGFKPEKRPFRAHLTMARAARHGRPMVPLPESLGDLGEVQVAGVAMIRSQLLPEGPKYNVLQSFSLPTGPENTF